MPVGRHSKHLLQGQQTPIPNTIYLGSLTLLCPADSELQSPSSAVSQATALRHLDLFAFPLLHVIPENCRISQQSFHTIMLHVERQKQTIREFCAPQKRA